MKRFICFMLAALIALLSGCSRQQTESQSLYYYCREEYSYGTEDAIIASELRDISGHEGDLQYLLSMYLLGPRDETMRSPFPSRTKLLTVRYKENTVVLEISDCSKLLTEAEFSLACACLALTCLELTDMEYVTIVSSDQRITLNHDDLLLFDNVYPAATEETK